MFKFHTCFISVAISINEQLIALIMQYSRLSQPVLLSYIWKPEMHAQIPDSHALCGNASEQSLPTEQISSTLPAKHVMPYNTWTISVSYCRTKCSAGNHYYSLSVVATNFSVLYSLTQQMRFLISVILRDAVRSTDFCSSHSLRSVSCQLAPSHETNIASAVSHLRTSAATRMATK